MANIKISELNSLNKTEYEDLIPIVDVSADETKKIEIKNLIQNNVELLAVSDTAPTLFITGSKYFNTNTNLIYTAISDEEWGSVGERPIEGIFYVVFDEQKNYSYDGTTLVSVGGGRPNEIQISDTEPTDETTKIWINEDGVMRFKNENDEWQGTVSSGESYEPIGSTKIYFGSTEPEGYKFANGQAISRETYSELFSLIGTTYGAGDGSTTFNLPDMSGRVPVGLKVNTEWFASLGQTGGSETHTLTIEEMPSHTHMLDNTTTTGFAGGQSGAARDVGTPRQETSSTGGGQAFNILQPYMTVNYIMKVKNIASEQTIVPDYVPIGAEISYSSNVLPDESWVWSDTNYLISDYPELATLYNGIFDDETTQNGYFKTPKKAGLVTVGLNPNDTDFDTIGKTIGEKEHTLTIDEMPSHNHTIGFDQTSGSDISNLKSGTQSGYSMTTSNTGGGQPHNILQPSIVSRFIIKAKKIEPNMSKVIGVNDTPNNKDVYSSNAVNTLIQDVYSTTDEIKTNKVLDGKPIYRKVIRNNVIGTSVNHGILNIDEITDIKLIVLQQSGLYSPQNSDSIFMGDTDYIVYLETTNISNYKITVEYTKTTD